MKYKWQLIVFVLVFFSCKKEPIQYTFGGLVSQSPSGSALSGATIEIKQRVYNGNVASSIFQTGGQGISDAAGNYEVSFDREKVVEFKLIFSKTGYFSEEQIINSGEVKTDETKIINETLSPESYIQFHLTNLGGLSTDIFTMIHFNFREGCEGCTTNNYYYYEGVVDSTFVIKTNGNIYTRFSYKNPGAASYISDSVFTTAFDTVNVNINY